MVSVTIYINYNKIDKKTTIDTKWLEWRRLCKDSKKLLEKSTWKRKSENCRHDYANKTKYWWCLGFFSLFVQLLGDKILAQSINTWRPEKYDWGGVFQLLFDTQNQKIAKKERKKKTTGRRGELRKESENERKERKERKMVTPGQARDDPWCIRAFKWKNFKGETEKKTECLGEEDGRKMAVEKDLRWAREMI